MTPEPMSESLPPLRSQLTSDVRAVGSNARWSAVLGGVVMAAALWVVLHLFGVGVGLTAIEPDGTSSLRAIGIGTGIWSVIAPIIALFVGGLVVSRLAPNPSRVNRMIQGGLVWAVATLATILMLFLVASSVVRGAASTGGKVVGAVAGVVSDTATSVDGDTLSALGIDSKDLLGPINQRLRADGKPEVTATQLEAAAKDALGTAVRTGSFDREMLVRSLASNTALSTDDANEIATAIESRWQGVRERAPALAQQAETAALQAAETTGKALMLLSIAMFLALAAAVGGALLTGSHDRRRVVPVGAERRATIVTPDVDERR